MLATFGFQGERVDALDLKCMLVSAGMQYPKHVYDAVAGSVRLVSPMNPFANPPGIPSGSHLSLCHDIYRNMDELLAAVH